MSKNDEELNEFIDEVIDGVYTVQTFLWWCDDFSPWNHRFGVCYFWESQS
jgi:hypothetical protein